LHIGETPIRLFKVMPFRVNGVNEADMDHSEK